MVERSDRVEDRGVEVVDGSDRLGAGRSLRVKRGFGGFVVHFWVPSDIDGYPLFTYLTHCQATKNGLLLFRNISWSFRVPELKQVYFCSRTVPSRLPFREKKGPLLFLESAVDNKKPNFTPSLQLAPLTSLTLHH